MSVNERDVILALVGYGSAQQREFGRTSLQKVAYFASLKTGIPLGHRAFYYGPYSEMVEDETESLVLSGLVTESRTELGFIGKKGFPGIRYAYELTDDGKQRLEAFQSAYPGLDESLKTTVASLADTIGSLDQRLLSLAAKTYFITAEQDSPLTPEQIHTLAKQKNWDISQEQIERVAQFLKKLDLIDVNED